MPPSAAHLSASDALAQLAFLVHGCLERRAGEREVSIAQTRLLGVLRDRRPTMNELARLLMLDKSSASGLVDRAEGRGLVARASSPDDGRAVLVELTERGRELVSDVSRSFDADIATMVGVLSGADRVRLTALLSRVVVAHASANGIDLFANLVPPAEPG